MEAHHAQAIEDFLVRYKDTAEFIGFLLAGSLAHGYATASADVDIIIVAHAAEYARRESQNKLAFSLWDICQYPGGYIDCKVVSIRSLESIADRGSDPARYAFKDARILRSKETGLADLLARVSRYPTEQIDDRQHRFACQLLAWKWYLSQAEEKQNHYLKHLATQKVTLYACRLILNHNAQLYPYHKWLLAEVSRSPHQPADFSALLDQFLDRPSSALAQKITDIVLSFLGLVEKEIDWPNQFMIDSELNWISHEAPVDDI